MLAPTYNQKRKLYNEVGQPIVFNGSYIYVRPTTVKELRKEREIMNSSGKLYEEDETKIDPKSITEDEEISKFKAQYLMLCNLYYRTHVVGIGITIGQLARWCKAVGLDYDKHVKWWTTTEGRVRMYFELPVYKNLYVILKDDFVVDETSFSSGKYKVPLTIKEFDMRYEVVRDSDEYVEDFNKKHIKPYIPVGIKLEMFFGYYELELKWYQDDTRIFTAKGPDFRIAYSCDTKSAIASMETCGLTGMHKIYQYNHGMTDYRYGDHQIDRQSMN